MRPLTLLESVASVSILGSVIAVFIPAFASNLHASRLSEPLDGLKHIGARASALADERPASDAYPPSVGLTPSSVPSGVSVEDAEGTWEHPTWKLLEFRQPSLHYYAFSFQSENRPTGSSFVARAHGDLDGDGVFSNFEIRGSKRSGEDASLSHVSMDREIE